MPHREDGLSAQFPDMARGMAGCISLRDWLTVVPSARGGAHRRRYGVDPGRSPLLNHQLLASALDVGELMVLVAAVTTAMSAWPLNAASRSTNRRLLVAILGSLAVVSDGLAAIHGNYDVVAVSRVHLGLVFGGFRYVVLSIGSQLVRRRHGAKATSVVVSGVPPGTVAGHAAGRILGNQVG